MGTRLQELKYYQKQHKHTSYSNIYTKDSPLTEQDYFNYFRDNEKDNPQIYSTMEHGFQGNYYKIYDELEKYNKKNGTNIKFVFGVEAYWVKDRHEKDNSNCHICLYAMTDNARKKINKMLSIANKDGYYYKPRIDLELLLSLPKNEVFVTTACIAFWNKYKDIDDIVLRLNNHFTNFYLEVQANNTESQKKLNKHILELSNSYNIPLIAGTDSHVIVESQMEDREDLLRSSNIHYDDEEGWYMDVPSLEVLIKRFQEQGVLNDDEIYEAINNTNKTLEFEDIKLDRNLKVPVLNKYKELSKEERDELFVNILRKEWMEQSNDINKDKFDEYITEIKQDIDEIKGCGMSDYFILSYEVMKLGQEKYGGILTPSGRGSAVSMFINKLLRLTKVDRINAPVLMYPERFLTKERVLGSHTPPDIDNNVSVREPFIQAQRDLLGELSTYDLIAFGTLHYKSAFKMYARAYKLDPQIANDVTKQIDKYESAMKYAEEDDKDLIDIYDYVEKEKYEDLIEGCQQYMGIIDNRKGHPCGTVCYNGDVEEDIGILLCKSETTGKEVLTAIIESGTIDAFGFLKQDYLVVDSIGLTYDIYKEIGIEPMTVNELLKEIDNNKKVWDIYLNGYTMCINQCEQDRSTKKVMKYMPQNISELTQFVAGIRPSFKTMYKIFESRQHFDYGIKAFDNLIQDEYCSSSFILYQETLMKVLGFAGFPMGETYTIIKAISKKKDYVIKEAKEKFIPNFAKAILDTKGTTNVKQANEMAHKVWEIVENSAQYGFNSAHAFCMAIDSVTLAWQKAYYPLEFYKVTLQRYTNKGQKDKVSNLKKEMNNIGIKLNPIKFRDDNREFSIDREHNVINQTMSSIKKMQKITPNELYKMRTKVFNNCVELFIYLLENTKINTNNVSTLIRLNYFVEFGNVEYLNKMYKFFCDRYKKTYVDNTKEKRIEELLEYSNSIKDVESTNLQLIQYQINILGYSDIVDDSYSQSIYIVEQINLNQYGTPYISLYQPCSGISMTYKCDKKWYNEYKCEGGDVLECVIDTKEKRTKVDNKWVATGEYEEYIKVYCVKERLGAEED